MKITSYERIAGSLASIGGGLQFWLLLAALSCTATLVYYPHMSYPYPLHVDEWYNILHAKKILEGDYNLESNRLFELGYHLLLAALSRMGFDLVLQYKLLPAAFSVASALSLYSMTHHLTRSHGASLYSVIFFASLPSNVNLLGLWFAVPLTASIPLVYLSVMLLHKSFESYSAKDILLFCILLMALLFMHPTSAFFVISLSAIYAFGQGLWKRSIKPLKVMAAVAATLALPSLIFLKLRGMELSWFIAQLVYRRGWTPVEPAVDKLPAILYASNLKIYMSQYLMPVIFGAAPFLLALAGLYYSLKEKKHGILALWAFYCATLAFVFVNYDVSILMPYQRVVYYSMLGLAPLAGIGMERLMGLASAKIPWKKIRLIVSAMLLAAVLYATFKNYGATSRGLEIYRLIDDSDYEASKFLAKQPDGKIIAPPNIAVALPVLASKDVLADLTVLGDEEMKEKSRVFQNLDCKTQRSVFDKYGIAYVYSKGAIECPSLKEIYSSKERRIYTLASPSPS